MFTGEELSGQIHYNYFHLLSLLSDEFGLPRSTLPTSPNDIVPKAAYMPTSATVTSFEPVEVSVRELVVIFHTKDDDKDDDTVVTVTLTNDSGDEFARGSSSGRYPDDTDRSLALNLIKPIPLSNTPMKVSLSVKPNGHDTWLFDYTVQGKLSNGKAFHQRWNNCKLNETQRSRSDVFTVAAHVTNGALTNAVSSERQGAKHQ